MHCGSIWNWSNLTQKSLCQKWKADVAFTFLSAIFWFVSALVVRRLFSSLYPDMSILTHTSRVFISFIAITVPDILIPLLCKFSLSAISDGARFSKLMWWIYVGVAAAGIVAIGSKP
jgi:hypothetical protein